jgi:hypothetical protein
MRTRPDVGDSFTCEIEPGAGRAAAVQYRIGAQLSHLAELDAQAGLATNAMSDAIPGSLDVRLVTSSR